MKHTYIIGEIGQNHNGSVDLAKLIIDLISRPVQEELTGLMLKPMDAVKLVKRDLNQELSETLKNSPYDSIHSFGKTYGQHRAALELSNEQHYELFIYAKNKELDFVETLCAVSTLELLKLFIPDMLKVASRDLTNLPLIEALAETKIPIILSTGMSGQKELDDALEIITKYHNNISVLHCVSEYPTQPRNVNLRTITYLLKRYPQYKIGFSDHTVGISAPVAAVALGAELIEKHVTIDRSMKGTDQQGSLGPDGVNRMIRDIRVTELSMGKEELFIDPSVKQNQLKLERSIAVKRKMKIGEIVSVEDLHLLSPGNGFKWKDLHLVINKKIIKNINANEIIYPEYIE